MSTDFWIEAVDGETVFGTGGRGFDRLMLSLKDVTPEEDKTIKPFDEDFGVTLHGLELISLPGMEDWESDEDKSPKVIYTHEEIKKAFGIMIEILKRNPDYDKKEHYIEHFQDSLEM